MADWLSENRREQAEAAVRADALRHPSDDWQAPFGATAEYLAEIGAARVRLADEILEIRAAHAARCRDTADRISARNDNYPSNQHWIVPAWVRAGLSQFEGN